MKVRVPHRDVRVPGFLFAGVRCGLKERRKRDIGVIASVVPATLAGAVTTNRVKAAPVVVTTERLRRGRAQAIVVNSGNANAYTGKNGLAAAHEMCRVVARELRIPADLVVPSSTGRIGVPLPWRRVRDGATKAARAVADDGFHRALEAMMTTDAFPKFAAERIRVGGRTVTVAGMAKGAGMIAPNMAVVGPAHATLLSYVLTDARVPLPALRRVVREALPHSFNSIVVDGDMSTNDTLLVLANGVAGNSAVIAGSRDFGRFAAAVTEILRALSRMIVKDGEGATKVVDIVVRGARSGADAAGVADTIARSPLCKAAFYGCDPYAGRIVCAAGYSGAVFDPNRLDVYLDKVQIVRRGREIINARTEPRAAAVVGRDEFTLTLDLHAGRAGARRTASDLSVAYVRFNSDYRT